MKDGFIKVGATTPQIRVADPAYNADSHIRAARAAADAGVRVLVFPELSLTAYTCSDLFLQSVLIRGAEKALARYAAATRDLPLISFVGLPVAYGEKLYNCAAAVSGGVILGLVPKTHLPNYAEFYEQRHFTEAPAEPLRISYAGQQTVLSSRQIFTCAEMPTLRISAEICEDLWVSVPPSCEHAAAGATLLVNLSASDEAVGKSEYRRNLVSVHSARLFAGYIFSDAGEGESGTDMVFSGNSLICDNGRVLAERPSFGEGELVCAVLDTERLCAERRRTTTTPSAPAQAYRQVSFSLPCEETELCPPPCRTPFIPGDAAGRAQRCDLILKIQAAGLAGRIGRAHADCTVIGLSGGLDSTLALLVAVRAADRIGMSRRQVIGVTMPCFGTTKRTRGNAEALAEALGVTLLTVDIHDSVRQHFRDIGHDEENRNVVYENAQARERTQVLMDLANGRNGLVVGTGDLSELALGWATYNGDHMSMYGVNASLPKTLVRHIVSYAADCFREEGQDAAAAVLTDILNTPVSPELLPPKDGEIAQCTEELVGPYELHDFFLYYLVRFGFSPSKILRMANAAFAGVYDPEVIRGWLRVFVRRFFAQQFKRSCLPDGPKVGSVVLSPRGDWRMPSDASAAAWLEDLT